MNKYVLTLSAAALIAAAPAYYAFQAQAEEAPATVEADAPEASVDTAAPATNDEAAPEAAEPASGETTDAGTNE